jgi:hypothetical protein
LSEPDLSQVLGLALREASGLEAFRILKTITNYHRIQISDGLLGAMEALKEIIEGSLSAPAEVRLFKVPANEAPKWLPVPPFWNLRDAWAEIGDERVTFRDHPTVAVAHSPPTDGVLEAEAVVVERWWDPQAYRGVKGKIVVTSGNRTIVYRLASEAGAAGLAFYREGIPETAVPYVGLFLSYRELKRSPLPSVALPRRLVRGIEGKRLRIYIDSEARPDPEIPVLCARIGEQRRKGPLLVSHICHPSPGANDNASGSAANAEALLALSRILSGSRLKEPEETIRFLWVPEYTGTVVAVEGILKGKVSQVVNLDMVGVEPGGPEGPFRLHLSSLSSPGEVEVFAYLSFIRAVKDLGLGSHRVEPYSGGSDHDVFIAYGAPGVMFIQWPDTRYHTDEDDVDRISKRMLKISSSAALSALYLLASEARPPVDVKEFRELMIKGLYMERLSEGDRLGASLLGSAVARHYGLREFSEEPKVEEELEEIVPKRRVPIAFGVRQVSEASFEKALELSKILKDVEGLDVYSVYLMEPVFLSNGERSLRDIYKLLRGVYGRRVSVRVLSGVTRILCDTGLLSC